MVCWQAGERIVRKVVSNTQCADEMGPAIRHGVEKAKGQLEQDATEAQERIGEAAESFVNIVLASVFVG